MDARPPSPDTPHAALGVGAGCAVLIGVSIALSLLFAAWSAITGAPIPEGDAPLLQAVGLPIQHTVLALTALGLAWFSSDGVRGALALGRGRSGWLALLVLPVGHLADRAVSLARALAPSLDRGGLDTLAGAVTAPGLTGVAVMAGAFLFAPVAEELLFRGYVYRGLERGLGPVAAVGLTATAFGLYHFDPVHIIGALTIGLWLGWLRWATGAIWPCIAAHMLNNGVWILSTHLGWEAAPPGWADAAAIALVVGALGVVWKRDTS